MDEGDKAAGPPAWLAAALEIEPFDVRPILADGEDPFSRLMDKVADIGDGGALVVDAPFNPTPLRRTLAKQGFSSYGRKLAAAHWRIYFHQDGGADWEQGAEVTVGLEGAASWREEDGLHIDVRKLAPPGPMVAILRLIEGLNPAETVVVHHERMPQFLIPELAERGWRIDRVVEEFANVQLWLERG